MVHDHSKGQPAQFLVEHIALLPVGEALDIAMGEGANSVYLAKKGFHVLGVDKSPQAVQAALNLAQQQGVDIKAVVNDLEDGYEIGQGIYDVIICFNYLQRSLIPAIKQGLKAGGMVVYETYITDQAQLFGKPSNPDYLLQHNELLEMFSDFRVLRYSEGVIEDRKAVAGLVAQKV
jgi:tellurite methyltransferase